MLQSSVDEGMAILSRGAKFPAADKVIELFTPCYSAKKEERELEEVIIYNWTKFLKKVERKSVIMSLL
jgi:hypothetical protein